MTKKRKKKGSNKKSGQAVRKINQKPVQGRKTANKPSKAKTSVHKSTTAKNTTKRQSMSKKRKNRIGTTLSTQDNYMTKSSKPKKRWVAVIEQNDNDELGVVSLESKKRKNNIELKDYKTGNQKTTFFSTFLDTEDCDGKPIKVGTKFTQNNDNSRLTDKQVGVIKKRLYDKAPNKEDTKMKRDKLLKNKKLGS